MVAVKTGAEQCRAPGKLTDIDYIAFLTVKRAVCQTPAAFVPFLHLPALFSLACDDAGYYAHCD